jgi:ribosome-associated protein YbcJ (S4-like RNA binding protein)
LVNGMIETRRGRKLVSGERVTVGGQTFRSWAEQFLIY